MSRSSHRSEGHVRYIFGRLLGYRKRLLLFAFTTVGTAVFTGAPMLLVNQFFRLILEGRDASMLLQLAWVMLAVYLLMGYFTARREVATRYLAERIKTDIVNETAEALLGRPLSYFGRMRTGELISRIMTDAQAAGQASGSLLRLLREPFTVLAVVGAVVYLNWRLALIGFVGFPLAAFPIVYLGRRIRKASQKARELTADLSDAMVQGFSGIKVVKAYRLEDAARRDLVETNNAIFHQVMRSVRAAAATRPVVELVNGIGFILVVLVGGGMVMSRLLDAEELFTFVVALVALHKPTRTLSGAYNEFRFLLPGLARLRELLEADDGEPDGEREAPPLREGLAFRDVSFRYDREDVLKGVSVEFPAGKVTAVVGPTGSGKTTLLDLVMRFYRPVSGVVTYDGVPLEEFRHESLLGRMSYAPQRPVLFNVSVRENVRMGRPGASDEEVEEACRAAGVHEEIMRFEKGYDTPAGEAGRGLSGGQAQRVALARALLRDADVYLFDEPASALDAASEAALYERMLERLRGKAVVLVTHRLAVLEKADRIVVVSGGRVEASGTHEELLERSPTYRMLSRSASVSSDGGGTGAGG